jgi:hypothetical protein
MSTSGDHPRGLVAVATLWFPVLGPIAAWAVHILYIASFARFSCTRPSTAWTMHAVTAGTLAIAALAMLLSARWARRERYDDAGTVPSALAFLGRLGLAIGAFNVILIVLEEIYVLGLHSVRCGGG